MKAINQDKLNEKIAAALLRRSQAMAAAVRSLQANDARTKRNQVAIRALQLVKADRQEINKGGK